MVSSEISTDFTVNKVVTDVANYVPTSNFLNHYWCIVVGILVIVGIIYFVLRRKKRQKRKKVLRRKK